MAALVTLVPVALLGLSAAVAYLSVRLGRGSGDRVRARRREQPLAHELPYWAFLEDGSACVALGVDLGYSTFLELSGVDTDCLDNEALSQTSFALHGLIQNLPAGATLQFLHQTDGKVDRQVERYQEVAGQGHELGAALVSAKAEHVRRAQGLRRSRLFLCVGLPNSAQKPAARALGFTKKYPAVTSHDHMDSLRLLRTLREQVARALKNAGVSSRPLSGHETRVFIYQLLNPRRAEIVADPFAQEASKPGSIPTWADSQSAREQLLYTGILEDQRALILDEELVRVLTLRSLPSSTEPALLEALLFSLPFHCRVHFAVETLDSLKVLDELKRKRDQAHLLATLREKRNQEAEAQEHDVAELIDKNLRSSIRMVKVALSVVLRVDKALDDAQVLLEKQTAEVLRVASGLYGAQMMVDEYNQLDEFLATLPANASHGRRWLKCTSENASHLLLAWQSWGGSARPAVLVENGRGNLVGLDPFEESLDNPNAFMAGASGAGKSSTTNYLLLNLLASGAKALVVDVGGSYRRVIDIFGGQYFAVSMGGKEDVSLNLFFGHRDVLLPDGKLEDRRLQFMLAVVERMVCDRARPELRNTERAVLAAAIEQTYAIVTDRTPLLSDLLEVLRGFTGEDPEDQEIARTLARALRIWTDGPAGRLLNRPSTIELTTDCAAFDLKGLEVHKDLQAVVMLILSGIIWNLVMRDPTERKIVVFDEVWRLLESPASAQLIAELYRTSRKYRCSILTISQSVEDFTGSAIAPALINNSATVYLLKHRRGHDIVAKHFGLNARELYVFSSLEMRRGEYTEALILAGEHHFLARIVLSPLEYWIATTHPADLEVERTVKQAHPEKTRLDILRLLSAWHPRGAQTEGRPAAGAA